VRADIDAASWKVLMRYRHMPPTVQCRFAEYALSYASFPSFNVCIIFPLFTDNVFIFSSHVEYLNVAFHISDILTLEY